MKQLSQTSSFVYNAYKGSSRVTYANKNTRVDASKHFLEIAGFNK